MSTKKKIKIDMKSKAGKYFLALQKGSTKKEAALTVGIDPRNVNKLEDTQMYQAIEKKYFKDELLDQITLTGLAQELLKNIVQDTDRGAKNKAIEIALSKLEPEKAPKDADEKVLIVIQ